jgi:hypothetical protein
MTVPIDRLYQYILAMAEQIRNGPVLLYRFYPHGSKDINHLSQLFNNTRFLEHVSPMVFCNDQEPLDFDRYADVEPNHVSDRYKKIVNKYQLEKFNFQFQRHNIYDKSILVHSEQRSADLKKYTENGFIPVYYWCHAVIALDWFRYAKHVQVNKDVKQKFLIYNRAWTGTREYRLKFSELLVEHNLQDYCRTSFASIDAESELHYTLYQYRNYKWKPRTALENFFPVNVHNSNASADFNIDDYRHTDIEVVLETLFDDRLHLTEKSLRPIACAQPFILAGSHGSLEYLRSYGFQTFSHVWDESYDLIQDPEQRLISIIKLMQEISTWTAEQRRIKMLQAQAVADYNKKLFFSQKFFNNVTSELHNNFAIALDELERTNTSEIFIERRKKTWSIAEFKESWFDFSDNSHWPGRTRQDIINVLSRARYYYNRRNLPVHEGSGAKST